MPLREDLLAPIPGDNPSGVNLRYDAVTDKIKEARREDLDVAQGDWKSTLKVADHNLAIRLASEALATRGKDLQIAVWLVDSHVRKEGLTVLPACFRLINGLCTEFWDTIYPEIEDGDLEMRAAPLDWLGTKLEEPIRRAPLTSSGLSWLSYQESRSVGYESPDDSYEKRQQRAEIISEGKLTGEDYDKAVDATPLPFVENIVKSLAESLEELASLTELLDGKFGSLSPSFLKVQAALEEIAKIEQAVYVKKGGVTSSPEGEPGLGEDDAASGQDASSAGGARSRSARRAARPPDLDSEASAGSDVFDSALEAAGEGQLAEALSLLQSALASELSPRGRFRRRAQIAHILIAARQDRVAQPILEDLVAEIEARKLEDWENAEVIAYPLFLLMRCSLTDESTRQSLFLRLCRLDPLRAAEVPE
jgi:type VI secretion system protein ImpA